MTANPGKRFFGLFSLAFCLLFLSLDLHSSLSRTTVRPSPQDECTRTVFLEMEIFTNDENITPTAMRGIADMWQKEIENKWNGPTEEAIREAASELGVDNETLEQLGKWNLNGYPSLQRRKKEIEDKAAENMAAAGIDGTCTTVNCCKIFFHVVITVRHPDASPTPGADQIEVMGPDFRSFVRVNDEGNQNGTSGEWAFRPGKSPAAHEAGHLMGLDDMYHSEEDEEGESHNVADEGHEMDLMSHNNAWPKSEHLAEILRQAGQSCDCCKNTELTEAFLQDLSVLTTAARDAIAGNNCEQLKGALQNLEEKLADLHNAKVPVAQRVATGHQIQNEIERVKKALEDCPDYEPPATTTGPPLETLPFPDTGLGVPGDNYLETPPIENSGSISSGAGFEFEGEETPTVPFSFDSLICETYGGGTFGVPIIRDIPFFPLNQDVPKDALKGPGAADAGGDPAKVVTPLNENDYDRATRVIEDVQSGAPRTAESGPGYQYDPNDNVIRGTDSPQQGTTQGPGETGEGEKPGYTYDSHDRLIESVETPAPRTAEGQPQPIQPGAQYDANDNIIRETGTPRQDQPQGGTQTPAQESPKVQQGAAIDTQGQDIVVPERTPVAIPGLFSGRKEGEKPELLLRVTPKIVSGEDEGGSPAGTAPAQENQTQTRLVPTWIVFKVEQDVVQQDGTIEKGPAEKTVMKLGFPPPEARPGSDVQRTAEDTNNGASANPRFTETDSEGFGAIPVFPDGFKSGNNKTAVTAQAADSEETSGQGRPNDTTAQETNQGDYHIGTNNYLGFTLDATPMKSRIVYLDTRFLEVNDTFFQDIGIDWDLPQNGEPSPDDTNANGAPDWTEKGPGEWHGTAPGTQGTGGELGDGGGAQTGQPQSTLPEDVKPYVIDGVQFGNTLGITLGYKHYLDDQILDSLSDNFQQVNNYRQEKVNDPYFQSKGTWGQPYEDQWAIKSVGFTGTEGDAWQAAGEDLSPVIVAFIDTGLDWNHADISWDNVWVNEDEIPDNGIDDDFNGYVDDTIGWDFYANTPTPWDQDGHGTFTAGMIIAGKDNGTGIAGINPAAKVMILKALNDFGHTRASYLAKAIKYATDNGARIINLSIGGDGLTYLEELAVRYAHDRGVLIIVAAGNEAREVAEYGLTPYEEVIAVASSDFEGQRAFFSNHGPEIDIAAPGLDILSLRARMTDFMRHQENIPYEEGSAYVGADNRYFRSSGTSFSAPIVTGIASLILSKNPNLTNIQVKRMLLNSARDADLPGIDRFSGYGVVDAVAALNADPDFEILADITAVEAVQDENGAFFVKVTGTAGANHFDGAVIQIGAGESPAQWKNVGGVENPAVNQTLAVIEANEFRTAPTWTIRLLVRHKNGQTREQWYVLQLG